MSQEFIIKSQDLEDKINQLLPSQGGFQAGVDLSASTQIIPIVDLTETAEGSSLRQDLQSSLSLNSCTTFSITNTTTNMVTTAGYFRVFGTASTNSNDLCRLQVTDGITTKILLNLNYLTGTGLQITPFDFIVFLQAGHILQGVAGSTSQLLSGVTRQLATLSGDLVSPI